MVEKELTIDAPHLWRRILQWSLWSGIYIWRILVEISSCGVGLIYYLHQGNNCHGAAVGCLNRLRQLPVSDVLDILHY